MSHVSIYIIGINVAGTHMLVQKAFQVEDLPRELIRENLQSTIQDLYISAGFVGTVEVTTIVDMETWHSNYS